MWLQQVPPPGAPRRRPPPPPTEEGAVHTQGQGRDALREATVLVRT